MNKNDGAPDALIQIGVFRTDVALTDAQIKRYAPAAFTRPNDYKAGDEGVSTIDLVNVLRKEGFEPVEVCQARTRAIDRSALAKHMVRLRHPKALKNADGSCEVVLVNNPVGARSVQLMSGFFATAFSNALIAGDANADFRRRRGALAEEDVVNTCKRVMKDFERVIHQIRRWKTIPLNRPQQELFAHAAAVLRFGEDAPLDPAKLLRLRRWGDHRKNDLWATFNRVQENVVKGRIERFSANGRPNQTRAISGVTANVKINTELWKLAECYASIIKQSDTSTQR
jgi:hypothetical protein